MRDNMGEMVLMKVREKQITHVVTRMGKKGTTY